MPGFHLEAKAEPTTVEWYTPPEIFDALGLHFDLDPCSPGHGLSHVPADHVYTRDDDGLVQPWFGTVFVNPPYGRETKKWLNKLAQHNDGIALVFARTDTQWFHDAAQRADALCFTRGRIAFRRGHKDNVGGGSPSGSVLIAYGETCAAALASSGLGLCVSGRSN